MILIELLVIPVVKSPSVTLSVGKSDGSLPCGANLLPYFFNISPSFLISPPIPSPPFKFPQFAKTTSYQFDPLLSSKPWCTIPKGAFLITVLCL